MKYIKLFENATEPKQGDYVVCDRDLLNRKKYDDKIGRVQLKTPKSNKYMINFDGLSSWFSGDEIIFFSSRKEDVETFLDKEIQKYNL